MSFIVNNIQFVIGYACSNRKEVWNGHFLLEYEQEGWELDSTAMYRYAYLLLIERATILRRIDNYTKLFMNLMQFGEPFLIVREAR